MDYFFDHEKLQVYQVARELSRDLRVLLDEVARGNAESKDNLMRASKSITRCIAEGAGRWSVPDKTRFYHIARASATECASALDELVDWSLVPEERVIEVKAKVARVVAMLIGMIRSLESRGGNQMIPRSVGISRPRPGVARGERHGPGTT